MNKKIRSVSAILLVLLAITLIVLAVSMYHFGNKGKIRAIGLEIYSNPEATNKLTEIDWGTLEPGQITNVTIYTKNIQTLNFIMNLTTSEWNPVNSSSYIFLTWNYQNQTIVPGQIFPVILTLSISLDIHDITSFQFTITITAIEN